MNEAARPPPPRPRGEGGPVVAEGLHRGGPHTPSAVGDAKETSTRSWILRAATVKRQVGVRTVQRVVEAVRLGATCYPDGDLSDFQNALLVSRC